MKSFTTLAFLVLISFMAGAQVTKVFVGLHGTNMNGLNSNLAIIDPVSGIITNKSSSVVCAQPALLRGSTVDTAKGIYYFECTKSALRMLGVDIKTGLVVLDTPVVNGFSINSIAFNPNDGMIYGIGSDGTPPFNIDLMRMDPGTGLMQAISSVDIGSVYHSNTGVLDIKNQIYYFIEVSGANYKIIGVSIGTGTIASDPALTYTNGGTLINLVIDRWSGQLYAIVRKTSPNTYYLASVNPATGVVTAISSPIAGNYNATDRDGIDPAGKVYYFNLGNKLNGIDLVTGNVLSSPPSLSPDSNFVNLRVAFEPPASVKQTANNKPSIKPNPANGFVTIDAKIAGDYAIELVDAMGRIIYSSGKVHHREMRLDVSSYPRGLYIIRTKTDDAAYSDKLLLE